MSFLKNNLLSFLIVAFCTLQNQPCIAGCNAALSNYAQLRSGTYIHQQEIGRLFQYKDGFMMIIDMLHKSHDAPVSYPIMHHLVTEMCTFVHISVTKGCILGYWFDALWELWNGSTAEKWNIDIRKITSYIGTKFWVFFNSQMKAVFFRNCYFLQKD